MELKSKPLEIRSSSGELPWGACLYTVLLTLGARSSHKQGRGWERGWVRPRLQMLGHAKWPGLGGRKEVVSTCYDEEGWVIQREVVFFRLFII